ncbi:hypothetical protein [Escherichia coli]|uniref:hypothetical protein n=1 Tax=Escherichia coli TaxID=562 RepID=UPI000BDF7651|nr:hypothetical protein [Escherichia coli]EEQ8880182.1 hypothetical protein [Escherichia coli]EFJ5376569.1 hypothetical protein [Escherichia coli]HAI8266964.1 hypothetical protein [Escherichia coli]HAI8358435.1 hypothetical protein [Escherichia coli]HAI8515221.1 hypothetical protein [Escherichia coli]
MESNIKGLVSAGHEMASELKAECGAVDMRSVAKLISDLATQLEVQLVRANALAAENAGLKDSVEHAAGCIAAAEAEGLIDALAEKDGERLADLIHRRLCHSHLPVETPATDAFLAEVRAQGVEMMREHPSIKLCSLTHICDELAAQIRKGVQS